MKELTFVLLAILSLNSCVSDAERQRDALAKELEEIKFGAPSLLADARRCYKARDFQCAKAKIQELISRHSSRPEASEGRILSQNIKEEEMWDNALSSQELYATQLYIDNYPEGKYTGSARARLEELKVANEEKSFEFARKSNSSKVWKQFLESYPDHPQSESIRKKIIELEVDEIFGDRSTGTLPSFERIGGGYTQTSSISIRNDTGCELTVRYSGPETTIIVIPSGGTREINLSSGSYRIAASACGANYAGIEQLSGSYSSSYYISRSRY
jgi:hypothetical protein